MFYEFPGQRNTLWWITLTAPLTVYYSQTRYNKENLPDLQLKITYFPQKLNKVEFLSMIVLNSADISFSQMLPLALFLSLVSAVKLKI